ncbi:MAG: 16S rRNA (guanine(966)-N(2))-methyltransferase RsmD [Clostridia bacterium]|nr:16S rRNA (guanine(966)-N(2))-methyltransferase RsmD [Clostridia bacterium]
MRVISGCSRGTKLNTIESKNTRPTLDRVKEALFNILQSYIANSTVLDLFAGSGALGIECLSRGAEKVVFSDYSIDAINVIKQNIDKVKFSQKANIIRADYKKTISTLKNQRFDIIFIDPPYSNNIAVDAVNRILKEGMLKKTGIIVLETDEEERDLKQLENIDINIKDIRKYGRVRIIFLCERSN